MADPLFFHVDLDAFFAAVEVLDDPSLKGKPLIIGHKGPRSVVSTCSYEARRFGVHSAMPMTTALRLCPQAVCVPGNMRRYSEKSKQVMAIIRDIAPSYIQASIDEAYLDMTGTETLYGGQREAALLLKDRVRQETGLTISVGVASSRFIAKLASDYRKPDGLTIVPRGLETEFVDAVGLRKLWGVGRATMEKLERYNIRSPADLRSYSLQRLEQLFGRSGGGYLYKVCRGQDPGIYSGENKSHSISAERTFFLHHHLGPDDSAGGNIQHGRRVRGVQAALLVEIRRRRSQTARRRAVPDVQRRRDRTGGAVQTGQPEAARPRACHTGHEPPRCGPQARQQPDQGSEEAEIEHDDG